MLAVPPSIVRACVVASVFAAAPASARLAVAAPPRVSAPAPIAFDAVGSFDGAAVRAWEKGDGLPSGTVSGFAESEDGTLWIATEEGLLRFDGQRIATVLGGVYAESVVVLADRALVGTQAAGVLVVRGDRVVPSGATDATRGHPTGALERDGEGALLGTLDGIVFTLDATRVARAYGAAEGLPRSPVRAITGFSSRIAVGTEGGLFFLDRAEGRARAVAPLDSAAITGLGRAGEALVVATEVEGLWRCEDRACVRLAVPQAFANSRFGNVSPLPDGTLLVASSDGLVRVDGRSVSAVATAFRGASVSAHVGRSGVLWLGAAGDASFEGMRAVSFRGVSAWHRVASSTRAVRVLPSGAALIATDADGLWRREPDGKESRLPLVLPGLESVRVLRPTADGSLLVGGLNGVLRWRDGAPQEVVADSKVAWGKVRSVAARSSGDLLLATTAGLWRLPKGGAPGPVGGIPVTAFVFGVVEIAGPRWLVTTQNDGLFVLDEGNDAKPVPLPHPYERGSLVMPGRLASGYVVIPHDRGVCVLEERTLAGRCLDDAAGLEPVTHLGAASDGGGRVWLPTNAGITSVDEAELVAAVRGASPPGRLASLRHFNAFDGMPVGECNGGDPNVLRLPDGRMAFACVGGIVVVDPPRARIDEQPPHTIVASVDVDGTSYTEPFAEPLDAGVQRLTFAFEAPAFLGDARNQRFLVKLEGFDRDWSEGDRTTLRVSYTNLPRGKPLRFSVRASNHDGVWNENAASFAFTIAPRWYERLGVQLGGATAFAGLLFGGYKTRTRRLKARAAELEAQVRARTAELVKAHEESERLLLNILPSTIAARLKAGERLIADRFEGAAVLFADVVGFTPRSARMTPEELVRVLDDLFLAFDAELAAHRIEKVKTIGDAYMAVAGVPEPLPDAVACLARFALAARRISSGLRWPDGSAIQLRYGLHVGPVVAGVVGERKTIYDLWGDTVNVASRMESHCEPGRIHVSEAFARVLGEGFTLVARGVTEVKGVGAVRTFWLED